MQINFFYFYSLDTPNKKLSYSTFKLFFSEINDPFFSCRRSRADLVVSFGVLVHVLVLEPLPLLSE